MRKVTRHDCERAIGNGAERYICKNTKCSCPYQTWCTAEKRYIPNHCAQRCKQYQKKENK